MQDLWNFALEIYAQPGVETACLELQTAGCDVCLLLTAAWLQRRGTPCRNEYLQALHELAEPWQREVIGALRQTRQSWRTQAVQDKELATLREQVKKLELAAERLLLQRLENLAGNWPTGQGEDDWLGAMASPMHSSAALQVLRGAAADR